MKDVKFYENSISELFKIHISDIKIGEDHPYYSRSIKAGEKIEIEVEGIKEGYDKFKNELTDLIIKHTNSFNYRVSKDNNVPISEVCDKILTLLKLDMSQKEIEEFYDRYNYKALCILPSIIKVGYKPEDVAVFTPKKDNVNLENTFKIDNNLKTYMEEAKSYLDKINE